MRAPTVEYSLELKQTAPLVRALPIVIAVMAAASGIALRFARLGQNSIWYDEGYTAWAIDHPVSEIIRIIRVDTAPPLYYILLHGWSLVFGRSEAALRSMSALMGSIAVLVFAAIACKLLQSAWTRASAILLFSFSFMQIANSHEARFYSMMTMMGAIDLYLVLLICRRSGIWLLAANVLAWIVSLYTNNMMVVYLGCLGLAGLILPGEQTFKQRLKNLLIVSIPAGICFLPWLPALLGQTRRIQGGFWPDVPDLHLLARTISVLSGVHEHSLPAGDDWFYVTSLAILGVSAVALVHPRTRQPAAGLIAFGLLPIALIFVYSQFRQSIFMERAFVAGGLVFPLLIGMSIEAAKTRPAKMLSAAIIISLTLMSFKSLPMHWRGEHAEQWREACAFADSPVANIPAASRTIICVANEGEILYDYYSRHSDYSTHAGLIGVPVSFFAMDPPQTMQRVQSDRDLNAFRETLSRIKSDELVLIASHSWWGDHDEKALAILEKNYQKIDERQFNQIKVFRFYGNRHS
jgi:4-amino-4-deoxy-L-arabinose transferase-like glycosyltransferase